MNLFVDEIQFRKMIVLNFFRLKKKLFVSLLFNLLNRLHWDLLHVTRALLFYVEHRRATASPVARHFINVSIGP